MLSSAVLAICALLSQPAAASDATEVPTTVRRLLRQLDDEQLAKREAAEKELIRIGPAALDFLPVSDRLSAEVKERLVRIRKTLEASVVEAATTPARVTLHGEMTLADAIASLEKQTGNKVVDFRRQFGQQTRPINLKLSLEKKTFWEALDAIFDLGELTAYSYGSEPNAVSFVARSANELPRASRAVYSGLFRFEGTRIEATRDLKNPANHAMRLAMDVAWEPRLKPILLSQTLGKLLATDENGNSLALDQKDGEIELPVEGEASSAEIFVPLSLPDRKVRKIASLKGTLLALAPGKVETFEFSELEKAKNVEQKRAGVTVVLEQLRKNVDVFEIRVRVKFDQAANALESHRGWVYSNPAYMIDAKGQIIDNAGLEATRQAADEVGLSYKFALDDGPAGHKFVYKTPAAILKLAVPYELKDIDLP